MTIKSKRKAQTYMVEPNLSGRIQLYIVKQRIAGNEVGNISDFVNLAIAEKLERLKA